MDKKRLLQLFKHYHEQDKLSFINVSDKLSDNKHLHAFFLLQSLVPSKRNIIAKADYDTVYLDFVAEDLLDMITDVQIEEFAACGFNYNNANDFLTI